MDQNATVHLQLTPGDVVVTVQVTEATPLLEADTCSDTPGSGAPFRDYLMGFPSLIQGTQMLDWGRQHEIYFGAFLRTTGRSRSGSL